MRLKLFAALAAGLLIAVAAARLSQLDRNAYQLPGTPYFNGGYEWWWHSLVARSRADGSRQPFFIQYYVVNPAGGGSEVVRSDGARRPSYAKVVAGAWGARSAVLEAYVPAAAFSASREAMDVRIGSNRATDTELVGEVAGAGPAERIAWNLKAEKVLAYDVGLFGGRLFQWLATFDMLWHVPGMQTRYAGTIEWNGTTYDVEPDTSLGYQDKNWGRALTAPWYWLSCNSFVSRSNGQPVALTSLDIGGGEPKVYGVPLGVDKVLIAFYHQGRLHEWNFTHVFDLPRQEVRVEREPDRVSWRIAAENRSERIEVEFANPASEMVELVYETPAGEKPLAHLWNGGTASGSVRLFRKAGDGWELVDWLDGTFGQGEYGIPAGAASR